MIQQKFKHEMFTRPGVPWREELLTSQAKNTMMHLNGQNLRLAAKNGRNSKTPGLHLSAAHGQEAVGRLTPAALTQECAAQLDPPLPPRSPQPDAERGGENLLPRRPLKLAPLELPEEVREAQRRKMKGIQQEAKAASRKLDVAGSDPCPRKVKACVREGLTKAPVCPLVDPARGQQQHRAQRPLLLRANHIPPNGERHLEDVVCRGVSAPMCGKPAPPSPNVNAQAAGGGDSAACQRRGTLQQETGRRRLRLRRAECLQEDQGKSTGGLSSDECKLAQGLQGKAQRAERALKEASRMLEKAARRNQAPQRPGDMEVSGRAIRRMAVSNLQDAVV